MHKQSKKDTHQGVADHTFTMVSKPATPYMDYIRSGQKHAEGRINVPIYQKIKAGDKICFHNHREALLCKVTFLHTYTTFGAMLTKEGVIRMLPQLRAAATRLSEEALLLKGIAIYEGFPNARRVRQYGCVAIGVAFLEDLMPPHRSS